MHWKFHGKNEGRTFGCAPSYAALCYGNRYTDLRADVCGGGECKTQEQAFRLATHWKESGHLQGRRFGCDMTADAICYADKKAAKAAAKAGTLNYVAPAPALFSQIQAKVVEAEFQATDMSDKFQCDPVDRDITDAACYGDRYATLKAAPYTFFSPTHIFCSPFQLPLHFHFQLPVSAQLAPPAYVLIFRCC